MKSILLIGLGRFGKHIAMKLRELNHQVMAVEDLEFVHFKSGENVEIMF